MRRLLRAPPPVRRLACQPANADKSRRERRHIEKKSSPRVCGRKNEDASNHQPEEYEQRQPTLPRGGDAPTIALGGEPIFGCGRHHRPQFLSAIMTRGRTTARLSRLWRRLKT